MKNLTIISGILFAYFCESSARILVFLFTPLCVFMHYCFGGEGWRERRDRSLRDTMEVGTHITPPLTWICLTISIMVFWAKILERFFFFEDHLKVANGTMILLAITILPFIIWWIRNKKFITDVNSNLRLGKKNRRLLVLASHVFFLLQLSMPFIVLSL